MKGDGFLRVPFLKKILIFDKYLYISKMLAYGTNVPWLEHFYGTENYSANSQR